MLTGFIEGFSSTADYMIGSKDTIDVSLAADDPLFPTHVMSKAYVSEVIPTIQTLFQNGVGSRTAVNAAELTRYTCMGIKVYALLRGLININYLAYHFDWTQISPNTATTPSSLIKLADSLDLTDIGLEGTWMPFFREFGGQSMFPFVKATIEDVTSPYVLSNTGRVVCPLQFDPGITQEGLYVKLDELITYMRTQLNRVNDLHTSFLPFVLSSADLTSVRVTQNDVMREDAIYNSGSARRETSDTSNMPTLNDAMIFGNTSNTSNTFMYFTTGPKALFSSILQSSIYRAVYDTIDDYYLLVTPHSHGRYMLLDDFGDLEKVDDGAETDVAKAYMMFSPSRFTLNSDSAGVMLSRHSGAEVHGDTIERLVHGFTLEMFSYTSLRSVKRIVAGSSLREVRDTVAKALLS